MAAVQRLVHEGERLLGERPEVRHDGRLGAETAEVAHSGDVLDGVGLPGQPFARSPTILLARAIEASRHAREIVEDDVRLHDDEATVAQRRHLAIAIDGKYSGSFCLPVLRFTVLNEKASRARARNSIGL